MSMPKFEDFANTITNEVILEIVESINKTGAVVQGSNINEAINSIVTTSTATSMIITLELLRRYHEWLSQQIEQ